MQHPQTLREQRHHSFNKMSFDPASLKEAIRHKAADLGCCAAGFSRSGRQDEALQRLARMVADGRHGEMRYLESGMREREDPAMLMPGTVTVLSVAIAAPGRRPCTTESVGLFSAHATLPDYHRVVREILRELHDFIIEETGSPVRGLACVDGAPVLEKAWAETAGLGRTGRNTLLIVPGAGSMIFLGELLLDIAIEPDEPLRWDPCGNCTACVDACPTGALAGDGSIDARRCISCLTIELKREFSEREAGMTGPWLFGCDLCMEACPHNHDRGVEAHRRFVPVPGILDLTAEAIIGLTGSGFRKLFAGTPVMRLGLKRLKRNARAVLRNGNDRSG